MRVSIFIFLILPFTLCAQRPYKSESKKAIKYYEMGLNYYNLKDYAIAEQYLKDAIEADENFQNAYLVMAELHWEQRNYEEAVKYYGIGLDIDPDFYPRGYLNKGKLEIKAGLYTAALASFQKFIQLNPEDIKYTEQAKKGIKQANFAIDALNNPVEFEPVNLGPAINTKDEEYWPSLSADGQTLVITRLVDYYDVTMGARKQEDFFYSKLENGEWSYAKPVGAPLNTSGNEGAQSISADGKLMVYTVCNRKGVIGRCDIFYSEKEGDRWSEPKNMGTKINTTAKETQPSISPDGRTIYFASDRPGGKGKLDLYSSTKNEEGIWSKPVNLGDSINTPGEEMSPFIHHDNKTLYFSSDYHIGMGGFDLFMTTIDSSGTFGMIKNLGYPINTHSDEVGLIVNAKGDKAYYASEMVAENGKDIYEFTLYKEVRPQEVSYLKGVVFDEESLERLKASFELFSLESGELISSAKSDERTGEFLICIPTNQNYMLNVDRKGYLFYSDNFSLTGIHHLEQPFLKDIPLKPILAGESIVLKNIFYKTDSYTLLPESKYELNKIVRFLTTNTTIEIEISGHTDNRGSDSYNLDLSENRAKSVVEYLVEKGIAEKRLVYKGYGFSRPIDNNDTEAGRANNRRTELIIINQ